VELACSNLIGLLGGVGFPAKGIDGIQLICLVSRETVQEVELLADAGVIEDVLVIHRFIGCGERLVAVPGIDSLPGVLLPVDDDPGDHEEDNHRPEVHGELEEDLANEGKLVCEGHVEVFLNHVSIMAGNAGKGTADFNIEVLLAQAVDSEEGQPSHDEAVVPQERET